MPAHDRCCLLVLQRVDFVIQCRSRLGQRGGRDGDLNQFAGRPGQQRAIADGKETKAKISKPPIPDEGLRCEADDRVVAVSTGKLMKEIGRVFRRHR